MVLSLSAMALAACGESDTGKTETKKCPPHEWSEYVQTKAPTELNKGEETRTCSKCQKTDKRDVDAIGFEYNVTFKDASGAVIKTEKVRSVKKVTKPEDPVAPAGQVFYGWKNVLNGGQIWDFDDDVLGKPQQDIELVPCFVAANVAPQYLEAELCPAITANGGMDGATYSGGAKGKQFVREDEGYGLGSTCEIDSFQYYTDSSTLKPVVGTNPDANGETNTMDPKGKNSGYFVHFNYCKGNEFKFEITSDKAVNDVTIFARFSAEYGIQDANTFDRYSRFSETSFPIKVNGTALSYGTITMHSIPAIGDFLPFQDFFLAANVSLVEGKNTITMTVDNEDTLNGTIASTSPCIDSLKLYTSANLTWADADVTNIIK